MESLRLTSSLLWKLTSGMVQIKQSSLASRLTSQRHLHRQAGSNDQGHHHDKRRPSIILGKHVKEAVANGDPIVALESTVITHGLPEPHNLELALSLERIVESSNICTIEGINNSLSECEISQVTSSTYKVTPATIGIIKGQLVVGLSLDEIEYLARRELSKPIKASRRDIGIAMGLGLSAGTTVSATMAIARSVKVPGRGCPIKVFATGGTGGVHRGGELSMDISADLYEFASSPMGVVCSGFKSFLDSRRSLELLESLGCPVVSLRISEKKATNTSGRGKLSRAKSCDQLANEGSSANSIGNSMRKEEKGRDNFDARGSGEKGFAAAAADDYLFPTFFSSTNTENIKSPRVVRSIEEAGKILFHCLEAPIESRRALLLANPIGREFSLDVGEDKEVLEKAMADIREIDKRSDLEGKEKTPLILERLNLGTGGRTLRANIELLKNNASVGAQLALKYAELSNSLPSSSSPPSAASKCSLPDGTESDAAVGVSGGAGGEHSEGTHYGPVVVGCTMIDMHVSTEIDDHFKNNPKHSGVTFNGTPHLTLGGVGRNLATAIQLLGHKPTFITSLGNDNLATFATNELNLVGFCEKTSFICRNSASSESSCFALILADSNTGLSEYVIANLEAVKAIDNQAIDANLDKIKRAPLLVVDANLMDETLEHLIEVSHKCQVPMFIEPTDKLALPRLVATLTRIANTNPNYLNSLLCLSPNLIELRTMMQLFDAENSNSTSNSAPNNNWPEEKEMPLDEVEKLARRLMGTYLSQLKCLLITMDKRGVLVCIKSDLVASRAQLEQVKLMELIGFNTIKDSEQTTKVQGSASSIHVKLFPTPNLIEKPVSASGAGDSFAAGFISGLLRNSNLDDCLKRAFRAAALTLQDKNNISSKLKDLAQE